MFFVYLGFHTVAIRAVDSLEKEAGNNAFGKSWIPYSKALVYFNARDESKKKLKLWYIGLK